MGRVRWVRAVVVVLIGISVACGRKAALLTCVGTPTSGLTRHAAAGVQFTHTKPKSHQMNAVLATAMRQPCSSSLCSLNKAGRHPIGQVHAFMWYALAPAYVTTAGLLPTLTCTRWLTADFTLCCLTWGQKFA